MQEASRRTGLSGPTFRYYEEVGLIGPIAHDDSSGHRRYTEHDVDVGRAFLTPLLGPRPLGERRQPQPRASARIVPAVTSPSSRHNP